jgi:CRISPR-associated exonuclease Cas4
MTIIATHINYLHICPRKLWLFVNGINMEHTSDLVTEGKLIGETTYPNRAARYKEIELSASLHGGLIGAAKIDFYDATDKVVHEVKKSNSREEAHQWQVRFYLYLLELNGIEGATGLLEYPKLRQTEEVFLTAPDREYLLESIKTIHLLMEAEECPPKLPKSKCKNCSYFDFCWVLEE